MALVLAGPASAALFEQWRGSENLDWCDNALYFDWNFNSLAPRGDNMSNSSLGLVGDIAIPKLKFATASVDITLYSTDYDTEKPRLRSTSTTTTRSRTSSGARRWTSTTATG